MQAHLWTSFTEKKRQALALEAQKLVSPFDLLLIPCQEDGGIETVRNLQQFLSRKPTQSKFNLALLTEAHYLTVEAQNALLKTLEDTPAMSKLILVAKSPGHLLPTVVSRCEVRSEDDEKVPAVKLDWEIFNRILRSNYGQRLNLSETIDLDSWVALWETVLYQKLNLEPAVSLEGAKLSLNDTLRYLKILMRLQKLNEDHVNSKLLASVMVMNAPILH